MGHKKRKKRLVSVAEELKQAASGSPQQIVDDLVVPIGRLCEAKSTLRCRKCADRVEHVGRALVDLLPCNIADESILLRLTLLHDALRDINDAHRSKFLGSRWASTLTCRLSIGNLKRRLMDIDSSFPQLQSPSMGKVNSSCRASAERKRRLRESARIVCQGVGAVLQALPVASVFSPIPKGFGVVLTAVEKKDQNIEAAKKLEQRLDRIETNGEMNVNTRTIESIQHCRDLLHKHQSRRNVERLMLASLDEQDLKDAECDLDRSLLDDLRCARYTAHKQTFQNGVIVGSVSMGFLSMTGARSVHIDFDMDCLYYSNMDLPYLCSQIEGQGIIHCSSQGSFGRQA